jgi:hypothetical protein
MGRGEEGQRARGKGKSKEGVVVCEREHARVDTKAQSIIQ